MMFNIGVNMSFTEREYRSSYVTISAKNNTDGQKCIRLQTFLKVIPYVYFRYYKKKVHLCPFDVLITDTIIQQYSQFIDSLCT